MSTFIVSQNTLNEALELVVNQTKDSVYQYQLWEKRGYDLGTSEGKAGLFQDMLYLNRLAVNMRYNEDKKKPNYKVSPRGNTKMQNYKSLGCLLYQCSESIVPQTDLYKQLKESEADFAKNLVSNSPEYDEAKWD